MYVIVGATKIREVEWLKGWERRSLCWECFALLIGWMLLCSGWLVDWLKSWEQFSCCWRVERAGGSRFKALKRWFQVSTSRGLWFQVSSLVRAKALIKLRKSMHLSAGFSSSRALIKLRKSGFNEPEALVSGRELKGWRVERLRVEWYITNSSPIGRRVAPLCAE